MQELSSVFETLKSFITQQMRMSHLYQPLMLKALIEGNGVATLRDIASRANSSNASLAKNCVVHRRFARRRVAMRGLALVRGIEAERPHPRRAHRRRMHLENPSDHVTVGEHVVVIVLPLAGGAGSR